MSASDSLAWIRDTYKVPAEIDQHVRFTGYSVPVEGRIIGAQSGHLHVLFDTEPGVVAMHPTWKVEYLHALPHRAVNQRCPCSGCGDCSGGVGGCTCDIPRSEA